MEINKDGYRYGNSLDNQKIIPGTHSITMKGVMPEAKMLYGNAIYPDGSIGETTIMTEGNDYEYPGAIAVLETLPYKQKNFNEGGSTMNRFQNANQNAEIIRRRESLLDSLRAQAMSPTTTSQYGIDIPRYQTIGETGNPEDKHAGQKKIYFYGSDVPYYYTDNDLVDKTFLRPYYVVTNENGDERQVDPEIIKQLEDVNINEKGVVIGDGKYGVVPVSVPRTNWLGNENVIGRNGANVWAEEFINRPLRRGYHVQTVASKSPAEMKALYKQDPQTYAFVPYIYDIDNTQYYPDYFASDKHFDADDTHYFENQTKDRENFYVPNKNSDITELSFRVKELPNGEDWNSRGYSYGTGNALEKAMQEDKLRGIPFSSWKGQRLIPINGRGTDNNYYVTEDDNNVTFMYHPLDIQDTANLSEEEKNKIETSRIQLPYVSKAVTVHEQGTPEDALKNENKKEETKVEQQADTTSNTEFLKELEEQQANADGGVVPPKGGHKEDGRNTSSNITTKTTVNRQKKSHINRFQTLGENNLFGDSPFNQASPFDQSKTNRLFQNSSMLGARVRDAFEQANNKFDALKTNNVISISRTKGTGPNGQKFNTGWTNTTNGFNDYYARQGAMINNSLNPNETATAWDKVHGFNFRTKGELAPGYDFRERTIEFSDRPYNIAFALGGLNKLAQEESMLEDYSHNTDLSDLAMRNRQNTGVATTNSRLYKGSLNSPNGFTDYVG